MSEFGVRKDLLIISVPTEKMGDLVVPQIHLKKVQVQASFMSMEGKMGEAKGD